MKALSFIKKAYICSSGYSYTNLGRLFLRLFVGIMLIQFAVRQIYTFDAIAPGFPGLLCMDSRATLILWIFIEFVCSLAIMAGFLTRLMTLPVFVGMIIAEYHLLHDVVAESPHLLSWSQQGYLPMMFLGIYFFLLIVGPGKISIDYFLSLHLLHTADHEEDELEEV
ncbi:MAG: DoxX family protein [Muribaculaceae bacterium]|nr:DoxX family protein [Muribaculaceae bacterium]